MEEIQDHGYLHEKWSTNKDHAKAERVIVCKVAKIPRVTSKQLKAFLTLANVNVHESTIRRTLSWWHWDTILQKENLLLKIMWTSQRTIGERMDETKIWTNWFKWKAIRFGEKNTLHSS